MPRGVRRVAPEDEVYAFPPATDYRLDAAHGLVWIDAAAAERARREVSQVETQHF